MFSQAIHKNANFVAACERAKTVSGGRLQLLGLVSDGGVHAHIEHLYSLLEGAKVNGVPTTYVHFFSDGRDTSPTSGAGFVQAVLDRCKALGYGSLATIMGRYYAMDRDKRWERIQLAVEGLVDGVGEKTTPEEVVAVVKKNYANSEYSETKQNKTKQFLNGSKITLFILFTRRHRRVPQADHRQQRGTAARQ